MIWSPTVNRGLNELKGILWHERDRPPAHLIRNHRWIECQQVLPQSNIKAVPYTLAFVGSAPRMVRASVVLPQPDFRPPVP